MKISEAKHFLSQFEKANEQKHYLTAHSTHHYAIIDTKSAKSLNTAAIADVVEECFEALKGQGISKKHRVELLIRLKTEIRHYNKRVYKSKTLFQKIGSWFGAVSDGEKKINSIAKLAEVERKTNEKAVKEFQQIHKNFTDRQESKLAGGKEQEKKIYMRMFGGVGSEAVRDDKLEGFSQSGGIKSYIEDLTRYEESLDQSKVGLKDEIKGMIQLLTKAYSISTLLEHANSKRLHPDDKKVIMEELQFRVNEEVQELAEKGAIGDQVLIPGGYELIKGDGHAVLYQIMKTGENTCSFTIINAGDGAKESTTAKGLGSSLVNMFSQTLFDANVVREKVQDIKYDNVQFKDLGLPFVENIFNKQFSQGEKKPMQVIKDRINTSLTKDRHVKKTTGREHSAQEIGSCTFKSISSWLKGSFKSEKEYNKFKAAHTEWDMEKLQAIRDERKANATTSKFVTKNNKAKDLEGKRKNLEQLNAMVNEGQKVLKKRQDKAR